MSTSYTDEDGKEYKFHDRFKDPYGDLVIISADEIAFLVNGDSVRAASPIFRSMFAACGTREEQKVELNHPSGALYLFLSALIDQPVKLRTTNWEDFKVAIELCKVFETRRVGLRLFENVRPINCLGQEHSYDLFCLAADIDDVASGALIIRNAGPTRTTNGTAWAFWDPSASPSKRDLMKRLPGHWAWAFSNAVRDLYIHSTEQNWKNASYICAESFEV
nr:uncharacterized protein CI109_005295 [Kwoniella shandongensis]KAA5526339.1 hypothetical protein CI109_005295 [Kwoniella shandongensis]